MRILIFLLVVCCSCGERNKSGILISDYLKSQSQNLNVNYVGLVNEGATGDSSAIVTLSKLDFFESANSEHGSVLLDIIDRIGEQRYIDIVKKFSKKERADLHNTLVAGLDFTQNSKYQDKWLDECLPELAKLLEQQNHQ